MRIRADPVKACSIKQHENTMGIPHFGGADPMRIRADPVGSVEAGGTETHWVSLILGVRIRCGSGRIRWDPRRAEARQRWGFPHADGRGSDADPGGSGGIRGERGCEPALGLHGTSHAEKRMVVKYQNGRKRFI